LFKKGGEERRRIGIEFRGSQSEASLKPKSKTLHEKYHKGKRAGCVAQELVQSTWYTCMELSQ
jgi:hypothetical protein